MFKSSKYNAVSATVVSEARRGFTLIEFSIMLVLLGLVTGAVFVGKDLMNTAKVRAQLAQIEKYNNATKAFLLKYDALPGDIPAESIAAAGFTVVPVRAGTAGRGDGNGLVEGFCYSCGFTTPNYNLASGEAAWFWEDLSSNAGLIEGNFKTATDASYAPSPVVTSLVLPVAKISQGVSVTVFAIGKLNYFGVANAGTTLDSNGAINNLSASANPGLTVAQAYYIDSKIDDGLPQSGRVVARYQNWILGTANNRSVWAAGGSGAEGANSGATAYGPTTSATAASATTCYDNGNAVGVQKYSMGQNKGDGLNCAVAIQFQ